MISPKRYIVDLQSMFAHENGVGLLGIKMRSSVQRQGRTCSASNVIYYCTSHRDHPGADFFCFRRNSTNCLIFSAQTVGGYFNDKQVCGRQFFLGVPDKSPGR